MNQLLYPACIWKKDNVFYVQFKDFKNGFTFGQTLEEAKEMAADVLNAILASCLQHNESIPHHSQVKGKNIYFIAPDAKVQAAVLLRLARASRTRAKAAKATGLTYQAYQKVESPRNNLTLSRLEKVAKAFNKRVVIDLIDEKYAHP